MKTRLFNISAAVVLTALLSSCASAPKEPEKDYRFLTRISLSGLKHFEIREAVEDQTDQRPINVKQARPTAKKTLRDFGRRLDSLEKAAHALIEINQFCRESFWILETDVDFRGPYLRGECNDLANNGDRDQFPDSIEIW